MHLFIGIDGSLYCTFQSWPEAGYYERHAGRGQVPGLLWQRAPDERAGAHPPCRDILHPWAGEGLPGGCYQDCRPGTIFFYFLTVFTSLFYGTFQLCLFLFSLSGFGPSDEEILHLEPICSCQNYYSGLKDPTFLVSKIMKRNFYYRLLVFLRTSFLLNSSQLKGKIRIHDSGVGYNTSIRSGLLGS